MSEQELLLLSNYVYMDASADPMTIGESLDRFRNAEGGFDAQSVASAGIGGGMSREQAADLFTRMDAMPDSFRDLYPSRIQSDADFRGICYTDGKADGGKGTVVFRGTGGTYDAWHDNVVGEYLPSTKIQKQAADFVNYDCMGFDDLTVTGHSKGGNLAMYTTVMCASVAGCVSFDGQGFSLAFLRENFAAVAQSAGKIKSISAYNDFVNILLHCIAGEVVYAKNPEDGIDAHSSYYLLVGNEFDANGNLTSVTEQAFGTRILKEALDEITKGMDLLPEGGNEEISNLLGAYVAAAMSNDKGEAYEKRQIADASVEAGKYLLDLVPQLKRPESDMLRIETAQKEVETQILEQTAAHFSDAAKKIRTLQNRLQALSDSIDPTETIGYYVNQQLLKIHENLEDQTHAFFTCQSVLQQINALYVGKEERLASQITGAL